MVTHIFLIIVLGLVKTQMWLLETRFLAKLEAFSD